MYTTGQSIVCYLFDMCFIWPDQTRFSSRTWPKNLNVVSLQPSPILFIFSPPMYRLSTCTCSFLFLNKIYFVLSVLRVSLFAWNQILAFSSSVFALSIRKLGSFPEIWKVVSSANKIVKNSVAFGKSFIKI